jgi:hypothetical protein
LVHQQTLEVDNRMVAITRIPHFFDLERLLHRIPRKHGPTVVQRENDINDETRV